MVGNGGGRLFAALGILVSGNRVWEEAEARKMHEMQEGERTLGMGT